MFIIQEKQLLLGGGITDADVAYIENLIAQKVSGRYIDSEFDSEMKNEPRKDTISQAMAMKRAINNIRHNMEEGVKAAKELRDKRGFLKE